MGAHLPWYKRDVDAWRGGTRGMSLEERGFYSECLDAMWDLQGPIESDVARLAVRLCCNPRSVRKLLPRLVALGKLRETDAGYVNDRMMAEIGRSVAKQKPPAKPPAPPPVQPEVEGNSDGIGAQFGPKVPKKPLVSTRDLDPDPESDSESYPPYPHQPAAEGCSREGENCAPQGQGLGGSVSPWARRKVAARLGIATADPIVRLYEAWAPSAHARDPDGQFIAVAARFYRDATPEVRAACQGAPPPAVPEDGPTAAEKARCAAAVLASAEMRRRALVPPARREARYVRQAL